jgi:maltokinase
VTAAGPRPASALADDVGRAGWAALLPAHRADGDDQPTGRPSCVDAMPLGDGLVLAVLEDEAGRTYPAPLVVTGPAARRATPGDGAGERLVSMLGGGDRTLGSFEVTAWHHEPAAGERGIDVDQTNESLVVGERAVVKWSFRTDACPHPAPGMLVELARSGFTGMPRPWGTVQWRPADGSAPRLLALVVELLPGAADGWTWMVEDLREAAAAADQARAASAGAAIGRLVASFHLALAHTSRPSTPEEALAWRSSAVADLEGALAATSGRAHEILLGHEADVRAVLEATPVHVTTVMRVHGDLHIGQVLRTRHGTTAAYSITDFDGNPVVPARERGERQPPVLDVAAMAQSLTHAGLVVRGHDPTLDPDTVDRMAGAARSAFLDAYRLGLGDHAHLLYEPLLRPFAVRQVCREFTYAATHLPRWSYVPEAALPMLLGGGDR